MNNGYFSGRELSKIREHVFRRLSMIFIDGDDGLKSIREGDPSIIKGNQRVPSRSSFINGVGGHRSLILTVIALTIADLGAGDGIQGASGKEVRRSAYEALWGEDRPHLEKLCELIDLNYDEVQKLGYAMLRYLQERLIHSEHEQEESDNIVLESGVFSLEGGGVT